MDWDKLRVFHAVSDAGSLTHAGEQLHLSQSAISRQIRGLEEQLPSTLCPRHARGLLLTEQGELLYEATLSMTKRLNAAAARIRDSKDEVYGDLRVTATAGFGTLWLAPRLHKLFVTHPNLSVNLILTETILDLPMREADIRDAVACEVERLELAAHDDVRARGWKTLDAKRIAKLSPYDRAKSFEPLRGRNPCFAVGRGQRQAFFEAVACLRAFRQAYRAALEQWRALARDAIFPSGTWLMQVAHCAPTAPA